MRLPIATLAVGLLVLLAGCSGTPFLGSGEEMPEDVEQSHVTALSDADSFTVEYSVQQTQTVGDQAQTTEMSGMFAVDSVADRQVGQSVMEQGVTTQYTSGETTYLQMKVNESVPADEGLYQMASAPYEDEGLQPVEVRQSTGVQFLMVENVTYLHAETKMHDGVEVSVFEADEEATVAALEEEFAASGSSSATVDSFDSVVYLDDDGVVRYTAWAFKISDGEQSMSYDVEVSTTDVGSTTVAEPGWLSNAEEQQSNESTSTPTSTPTPTPASTETPESSSSTETATPTVTPTSSP